MKIKIKNLKLKTRIGIYDWEKNVDRDIIINAKIDTHCDEALKTDNIDDAIDYDHLVKKIKNIVASNRYNLIEKMAADIMDDILTDKRIAKCSLEIDKVGAVADLESFSVTIKRENGR